MDNATKTGAPVKIPLMKRNRATKTDEVVGYALVDQQDAERLKVYRWSRLKTSKRSRTPYAVRQEHVEGTVSDTRLYYMHREVLGLPRGTGHAIQVDHVDFDGLNNTRANLRICTPAENQQHRRLANNNKTGEIGICYREKARGAKWCASIKRNGAWVIHKTFWTEREAIAARDEALAKYEAQRSKVVA